MLRKYFPYCLLCAPGIIALLAMAWLIWGRSDPDPPIRYPNLPQHAESPARPGQPLKITVERCNDADKPLAYTISRNLVRLDSEEHETIVLSGNAVTMDPGCETVTSASVVLPADLELGAYEIRGSSTVRYGGREFAIPWQTSPFEVVPE